MAPPQRTVNETLAFISENLASRRATESMSEDTLKNKPTDDEIRILCQETILKTKAFTSGHQVTFCTIANAQLALTLALKKLHQSNDITKWSVIMAGGIEIGRDWTQEVFHRNGRMRFFKNGCEEVPGTLLWQVEVTTVPDGSGGSYKELKHDETDVWVPFKTGHGKEGAHLGDFYATFLEDRLGVANKNTGLPSARYFKPTRAATELTVWDTAGSRVNSIAMAMMHLLVVCIGKVNLSDDNETRIRKIVQDEVLVGHWFMERRAGDGSGHKPTFFSMGLLVWAISNRTELENKIMG